MKTMRRVLLPIGLATHLVVVGVRAFLLPTVRTLGRSCVLLRQ